MQRVLALSCLGLECGAKKMGPMHGSRVSVGEQGRRAKDSGQGRGHAGQVACWRGGSGSSEGLEPGPLKVGSARI